MAANPPFPAPRTCWLEVRILGERRLFEFPPGSDHAVIAGSLPGADVPMAVSGAPPVALHFERVRNDIVVTPQYHCRPRVNTIMASGPVVVGHRATIELPGVMLEAWVLWQKPHDLEPSTIADPMQNRSGYVAGLPSDNQTTTLALEAFPSFEDLEGAITTREAERAPGPFPHDAAVNSELHPPVPSPMLTEQASQHTEVMAAVRFPSEPPSPEGQQCPLLERTERLVVPIAPAFGPSGQLHTEVMAPVRFAREPIVARPPEKTPVLEFSRPNNPAPPTTLSRPSAGSAPLTVPIAPVAPPALTTATTILAPLGARDAPPQQTTAYDLGALSAEDVGHATPVEARPVSEAAAVRRAEAKAPLPHERSAASTISRGTPSASAAIEWLGVQTKHRPIAVLVGAAVAASVVALALLGATRLLVTTPIVQHATLPATSGAVAVAGPSASVNVASPPLPTQGAVPRDAPVPASFGPTSVRRSHKGVPSPTRAAAQHLMRGRHKEAEGAYAMLAVEQPDNPAYTVLVALLRSRTREQCKAPASATTCPEVRP